MRLRGYGDAIVVPQAVEFIQSVRDCMGELGSAPAAPSRRLRRY